MASTQQIKVDRAAREDERFLVSLPVNMPDGQCVMRDVSASGVFLEANKTFIAGELVSFDIEFDCPSGQLALMCKGQIVRIEDRNGKIGVGIKILTSVMTSTEGKIYMECGINVLSSSAQFTQGH